MKKTLAIAIAGAAMTVASPAFADIIQVNPSSIQGSNVLFNGGDQNGTTVTGATQGGTNVNFTGTTLGGGNILNASGGQASLTGDFDTSTPQPNDTLGLTSINFGLEGGAYFDTVELNLFGTSGATADFTLTDDGGQTFTFTGIALSNGQNRLGFQAINGQHIANVAFNLTSGTISDVRQVRIGTGQQVGGVPEPAAWALMMAGFGLTGAALRRPRRKSQIA
ncbi:MAG: PEPxxWA-CTERM sorting domain-containing protein [Chakrabartia sp.]